MSDLIVSTPGTLSGRPRLAGTRISAAMVWSLVADGLTAEEIGALYPVVTPEHVEAVKARPDLHCDGHGPNADGELYCCQHGRYSGWPMSRVGGDLVKPGEVWVVRGVVYVVTSVRPDGEPCLTKLGDQQ